MSTPDQPTEPQQPSEPASPYAPPPAGSSGEQTSQPTPAADQPPAYGQPPADQPPTYGQPPAYGQQPYGQAPAYGGYPGYAPGAYPKNSLGVWSLVLGIASIVLCGPFSGIPAIIIGNNAKRAVAAGEADNASLATGGVVTGWIGTILFVVGVAFVLLLVIAAPDSTVRTY